MIFENTQILLVIEKGYPLWGSTPDLCTTVLVNPEYMVAGNTVYGNGSTGIEADAGSLISENSIRGNGGIGLDLTNGQGGSDASSYRGNAISGNAGGTVSGGVNAGGNVCNGSTTCP